MIRLLTVLSTMVALGGAIGAAQAYQVVPSGHTFKIGSFAALDPTCRSLGETHINLLSAPRAGETMTLLDRDYPNFSTLNVRVACDKRRVPSTTLFYRSQAGYVGNDQFDIEVVTPTGSAHRLHIELVVR